MEIDDIFENTCRICLKNDGELYSLFDHHTEDLSFASIIEDLAKIKISEDDTLSKYLCSNCKQSAEKSYKFQQLCKSSDRSARLMLMKHKRGQNSPVLVKDEMGIEIDDDPMLEMSTIKGTYCLKVSTEYKPKY
jgi:hypothetical protein